MRAISGTFERGIARLALGALLRRREQLRHRFGDAQDEVARRLAKRFANSPLGQQLALDGVRDAKDLSSRLPIGDYETHLGHFERPLYWSKSTGTTSGQKKIPVTRDLLAANAAGFKLLLASALNDLGTIRPALRKVFFLHALAPLKPAEDGILWGAGTTIAIRERPRFFRNRGLPLNEFDHLPNWAAKLDGVVDVAKDADVGIAYGGPAQLLSFADAMERRCGVANLHERWPNLKIVFTVGTHLTPYRSRLEQRFGPALFRELFSSSEGMFAIQDRDEPGMLPLSDSVFFEFVPLEDRNAPRPRKLLLTEVEVGVEYVLLCSSFAGLFGYDMADTVRFISRDPPRLIVSGRSRQRVDVTGEKVTVEEVESAAVAAVARIGLELTEFSIVPLVAGPTGHPCHHWLVEVRGETSARRLAEELDRELAARNAFYRVRREGPVPVLAPPEVQLLPAGSYQTWLTRTGRIGEHNKVPRILPEIPRDLTDSGPP